MINHFINHLYEHAEKTGYENVNIDHFEILSNGYKNDKFKRKLAEALHIKHKRPILNVQEQSVPLKLFNRKTFLILMKAFRINAGSGKALTNILNCCDINFAYIIVEAFI